MTLEEYVALAVSKIDRNKPVSEWREDIEAIYDELEKVGYHHSEIFAMINKAIITRLKELQATLDQQLGDTK